ncbi:MAG TPA: hypothetical protein EYH50_01245 [Pyrodictium delaneyi]|uniref:Uncharacterized protein n=1 Tax=Pyrodictium delaneyi TaxID=1273541 RepID=A0A833EAJ2_9CREN|nr:hypothetical protein [Pyrodictium delaneyi]
MSLQWDPKWEEVVIDVEGIRVKALQDRITKLLACPICGVGDRASYFFNPRDLINHLFAHTSKAQRIQVAAPTTEPEEEEEEE